MSDEARLVLPDGRVVGTLKEVRSDGIEGLPGEVGFFASFTEGPSFHVVAEALASYDEIVSDQALSLLDEAEDQVRAHGLLCRWEQDRVELVSTVHLREGRLHFRVLREEGA